MLSEFIQTLNVSSWTTSSCCRQSLLSGMDPACLVINIYNKSEAVLRWVREVEVCTVRVARLGLRVYSLVCKLEHASVSFKKDGNLRKRVIELNGLMSTLPPLLEQCSRKSKVRAQGVHQRRVSELGKSLQDSEERLETLCHDLGLAVSPKICQALDLLRTEAEARVSAVMDAPASAKPDAHVPSAVKLAMQELERETGDVFRRILDEPTRRPAGSSRIGRGGRLQGKVCWDHLKETDQILGRGSVGVVVSGSYFGRQVVIKRMPQRHLHRHIEEELR